ncbi:MAG: pantetheine-phosphate adenylyltransferase [Pseudomonadota bacterium]
MTGRRKVAIYPGTFDPITNGHVDIVSRAVKLVDRLVIGVARNSAKNPLFSQEERTQLITDIVAGLETGTAEIEVVPFQKLLIHFAEDVGASIIIRGLRAVSDFEYEFQMAGMNDRLNKGVETVFLMADAAHQPISSSLVKEIARLGGNVADFIPPLAEQRLLEKVTG